ncbi:hypothetical protein CsSME_00040184 [Camellia sinensis var. sinensis]
MDVKNAFLNGHFTEGFICVLPLAFTIPLGKTLLYFFSTPLLALLPY